MATWERLLTSPPPQAQQRADALYQLGVAHSMLQNYPQSYEAFTQVLALEPNNAEVWYNRSMSSRFTSRFGRPFQDSERAVELNTKPELPERFHEPLNFNREIAQSSIQ